MTTCNQPVRLPKGRRLTAACDVLPAQLVPIEVEHIGTRQSMYRNWGSGGWGPIQPLSVAARLNDGLMLINRVMHANPKGRFKDPGPMDHVIDTRHLNKLPRGLWTPVREAFEILNAFD